MININLRQLKLFLLSIAAVTAVTAVSAGSSQVTHSANTNYLAIDVHLGAISPSGCSSNDLTVPHRSRPAAADRISTAGCQVA